MLARFARWAYRRNRLVVGIWFAALVLVGGVANFAVGSQFASDFDIPASESSSGFDVLGERFGQASGGQSGSIVVRAEQGIADPQVASALDEVVAFARGIDGVTVTDPSGANGISQIDPTGTIAYATLDFDRSLGQSELAEIGTEIVAEFPDVPGVQFELGGQALADFETPEAELIGLSFAVIILIVAFGSVLAMGLPIGMALFGVGLGLSVVVLISRIVSVPDFAISLGAMIGIAVGIDYALFIVTRYRDERRKGRSGEDAAAIAFDTAGRAVIFAGLTVVVSLLGMLLIGVEFVAGLGIAAATTVAVTMLASVTLLPALLGMAGPRIEVTRWRGIIAAGCVSVALLGAGLGIQPLLLGAPLAVVVLLAGFAIAPLRTTLPTRVPRAYRHTLPYRWSRMVQARPWTSLLIGVAILGILAAPVLSLRLGFSDEGNFSPDTTTRKAYDLLAEGFGPGFNGPLLVTGTLGDPAELAVVGGLAAAIAADPGVQAVSPPFPDDVTSPSAFVIQVIPTTSPQDEATADLVRRLRTDVVPTSTDATGIETFVTGQVAAGIDFTDYLSERLVVFIGVVLAVSFVLLMMVFRSVLVPIKAVLMNIISIAAAYGVAVAIFQWGWFGSVLGVEPAPIEPFVPMMMFAIVFGLSMDYEVFLLSRIREEWDNTRDAANSVADGLASTARVITTAAAIMIVVFGSFILDDNRILKLFGVGLAAAVFLDATLVRMLLVPATMELLGERNWWLPRWLDRILPHLNVEGPSHADGDHHEPDDADRGDGSGSDSRAADDGRVRIGTR